MDDLSCKEHFFVIGNLAWLIIQYFLCGYTLFTTIILINSLFERYLYFENSNWCYYSMIIIYCSFVTTIGLNFKYTFYFLKWLITYTGRQIDIRPILMITGFESPLTKACKTEGKSCKFITTFILTSIFKIIDLFAYTNSSLIMNAILSRSARVASLIGQDIPKDAMYHSILRRMCFTILISVFFMDIPQGAVCIYSLIEDGKLKVSLSDFTSFTSIQNSASFTIIRIIASILISFYSFISIYFFDTKLAVKDNEVKLLAIKENQIKLPN
jgi:hypothetical protein